MNKISEQVNQLKNNFAQEINNIKNSQDLNNIKNIFLKKNTKNLYANLKEISDIDEKKKIGEIIITKNLLKKKQQNSSLNLTQTQIIRNMILVL